MSGAGSIEKRQFGRRESAIHAIALIAGRGPAHCIVRNFSERGALLEFHQHIVPPFRFRLVIEAKGIDVHCEVRHQGQYGVGVQVVSGSMAGLIDVPQAPAMVGGPLLRRSSTETPSPRVSGAELRSALIGNRVPSAEAVRDFNADAGGIIRGT